MQKMSGDRKNHFGLSCYVTTTNAKTVELSDGMHTDTVRIAVLRWLRLEEEMNTEIIGENMKAILKARGMSQAELCRKTDIAPGTVKHHIDTGKMDVTYLGRYAEALGCTISDLVDGAVDAEAFTLDTDISAWYPWNLALAVSGINAFDRDGKLTDEAKNEMYAVYIPALLKSLESLTDREQKVLMLRFANGLNLEQCGYRFNVTRERIRQVEQRALRKLRHPRHYKHWHYDTLEKYQEAKEEASRYQLENIQLKEKIKNLYDQCGLDCNGIPTAPEPAKTPDIDIEYLELSVRSYNCLKRAGINRISDFDGFTIEKFMKVRNLGRKSMEEIISKLKDFGIEIKSEG